MSCISCGNKSLRLYTDNSYFSLPVFVCDFCGLYVTGNSEVEVKNKVQLLYKGEYWKEDIVKSYVDTNFTDSDSFAKKRQWQSQFEYCKSFLKNKKDILEIGVGGGQSIVQFDQRGYNVTGIEPDPKNVELINKKLAHGKCLVGFIEEIKIEKEFDVIWMSHVLEHLLRPDLFLEKIRENLKEDGFFFVEVPNSENEELLKRLIRAVPHIYHFTKKSLMNVSNNAGYVVISCDYFRPPTLFEGIINRIFKKYLRFLRINIFPFYPRIKTTGNKGRDLCIILGKTKPSQQVGYKSD